MVSLGNVSTTTPNKGFIVVSDSYPGHLLYSLLSLWAARLDFQGKRRWCQRLGGEDFYQARCLFCGLTYCGAYSYLPKATGVLTSLGWANPRNGDF